MGALLERREPSLWQGKHSDFFRNTFEEPLDIAIQRTTSYEAVMLCPAQRSREETTSSDREMPPREAGRKHLNRENSLQSSIED
jgi:hypothetical protein